jgi:molybdopterin-containing oxidoreductase family iron-sulfur binding subunit
LDQRHSAQAGLSRGDEFPEGAAEWPPGFDRRGFIKLLGASLALGGVAGCMRRSNGRIVPYVTPPEDALPGIPQYYATAVPVEGFARGILVESNLGRPTKIEGNPDHPESLGATDAATQAAILQLYDPERSQAPLRLGERQSWQAFEADWNSRREDFLASRGAGMALVTEPSTSPSLRRQIGLFKAAFPEARWYQHTPLASYAVDGMQPDYDFADARVVLSIGSDCFFHHPASIRYARGFASGRRVENGPIEASRFYAIEATPSVTGVLADIRLPASPMRIAAILNAVAAALGDAAPSFDGLSADEASFASAVAVDLQTHAPHVLCVAGDEQSIEVKRWALAINGRLGARGMRLIPAVRSDGDPASAGNIGDLSASLTSGLVKALVILGSNPGHTSVGFRGIGGLVAKLPFSLHLGEYADETAALCAWHLPEAHFLEAWGDLRAYDGTPTILQPLIEPLFGGRSALEVLGFLRQAPPVNGYQMVRDTWQAGVSGFEAAWSRWLRQGVADPGGRSSRGTQPGKARAVPQLSYDAGLQGLSLILAPDPSVLDGRWANNAWLQELPRPLTHIVWDNAALVSPSFAARLGASNGDLLKLECGPSTVEAAAWVMPGQADDCVTLSLGYGRTRAGTVGNGRGFDAYILRTDEDSWIVPGLRIAKTGRTYPLVSTQSHFSMEGRDIVRVVERDNLVRRSAEDRPSMYPAWKRGAYAWGMSIDLSTCLGCNACVVACQAENNTPVVGKDQVSRGREMHWIRIDQYFEGDPAKPRVLSQPVPCMHCETAPCELVCPVGATVHSSEGLNEMVYNRCVGTRYCSNNCPYKVRRFNFLDYRTRRDSTENLQKNPDVTVRERGVMEKCTYCVQRINQSRIAAEKENRPIRDGEIRTACQQACPVEAIAFGNISDPGSGVSQRKADPTDYSLLGELNTRPRTTYLAKIRNSGTAHPA